MIIKCIKCKGSDPMNNCGRTFCPIIAKAESMFKVREKTAEKDFFGASPAPFVGRYGYPHVNVGVLSPGNAENTWEYDAPRHWAENNYQIPQIVDFRSSLINSRFKSYVKQKSTKLLEISREVGMASKPVDVEINLHQKPQFRVKTDSHTAPMGPNASVKDIGITSNPKIHTKVDKVVSDTDLKSGKAMLYLYKHGFDENFLSKVLSVGNLGIGKNRKLVPTRWSITAVDDSVGKNIISEIKAYNSAEYSAYFGSYLGNYYLILTFPDVWTYELFEMYMPRASWNMSDSIDFSTDYESYQGRKDYAENTAGGYYAARLPILEKLKSMRKQATVLALRFITGEYAVPLGVWVVREATRKAMESKPITFSSKELMLKYASALVKKKFGYDINFIFHKSFLLKNLREQIKLTRFVVR